MLGEKTQKTMQWVLHWIKCKSKSKCFGGWVKLRTDWIQMKLQKKNSNTSLLAIKNLRCLEAVCWKIQGTLISLRRLYWWMAAPTPSYYKESLSNMIVSWWRLSKTTNKGFFKLVPWLFSQTASTHHRFALQTSWTVAVIAAIFIFILNLVILVFCLLFGKWTTLKIRVMGGEQRACNQDCIKA